MNNTNLVIQMAPLSQTFSGTPQEWSSEMVRRMKIVSPAGSNFIFTGDTEPSSNVGPWLKDGTQWYVWDVTINRYVPLDISASQQQWFFIGNSTPATADPPVWLRTTNDSATNNFGNPLSWYIYNGTAWVPFVGIVLNGPTAGRPTAPVDYQQYFDTDISVLLWWERSAWRTVSGVPGDVKFVVWETLDEALLQNPGWEFLGASNSTWRGRYISMATKDPGASPVSDFNTSAGVAHRAARTTYGETDGVSIDPMSAVPYPPTIALWTLVKV